MKRILTTLIVLTAVLASTFAADGLYVGPSVTFSNSVRIAATNPDSIHQLEDEKGRPLLNFEAGAMVKAKYGWLALEAAGRYTYAEKLNVFGLGAYAGINFLSISQGITFSLLAGPELIFGTSDFSCFRINGHYVDDFTNLLKGMPVAVKFDMDWEMSERMMITFDVGYQIGLSLNQLTGNGEYYTPQEKGFRSSINILFKI